MILHLDENIVVADKPAGLPTVPGRLAELHDCLWQRVRAQVADALVVHRLDMATSGLMLFARGATAQRALARDFATGRVRKEYVAVVAGAKLRENPWPGSFRMAAFTPPGSRKWSPLSPGKWTTRF